MCNERDRHQSIAIFFCSSISFAIYCKRLQSQIDKSTFSPYFSSWMTRRDVEESAFQCSDDVYDMKILHDAIVCGLRNGTVEIWNRKTLKKEFSLEDQNGSVQVHTVLENHRKCLIFTTLRAKRATFTFPSSTYFKGPNSVTRHIYFNRTKIGDKCQKVKKVKMRHFG